jgi:hypothetical protein
LGMLTFITNTICHNLTETKFFYNKSFARVMIAMIYGVLLGV